MKGGAARLELIVVVLRELLKLHEKPLDGWIVPAEMWEPENPRDVRFWLLLLERRLRQMRENGEPTRRVQLPDPAPPFSVPSKNGTSAQDADE